jgi:hypothetical protein
VPKAPPGDEAVTAVIARCHLTLLRSSPAEGTVASAGWIPFSYFDQRLVREDVEIVAGMRGADGMCRPVAYNLFVFVGGRFAGVLSPAPMTSRLDGSSGAVRLLPRASPPNSPVGSSDDPPAAPSMRRFDIESTGWAMDPSSCRSTFEPRAADGSRGNRCRNQSLIYRGQR